MQIRINTRHYKRSDQIMYIILVCPVMAILIFTIFFPVVKSAYVSFFDASLLNINSMTWNDFSNYTEVTRDKEFFSSFILSFKFTFIVVILQLIFGYLLALLLNSKIPGRRLFRSVIMLPWAIPMVVTSLLWLWIFQADYGILNYILKKLNIIDHSFPWTGNTTTALLVIIIVAVWRQLPYMTIMILSGMQTIPEDLREAAYIDGGNRYQIETRVVLPFLSHIIKSTTLIAIVDNFKMFPLIWIMTQGGPFKATTTLSVLTYETSFVKMDLGKGATIGVLWTLSLIIFSIVYNKMFKTVEHY